MGCKINCHQSTTIYQRPSTTRHYEHIKREIIHQAEGEFGVDAKVDVEVLVDFMLQVQIDMGMSLRISVFENEVFGIVGLIAFCIAIVLMAFFLRKCGCCCVTTTTNTNVLNQDARSIEAEPVMPRYSARKTLRRMFRRDLEESIGRKKDAKTPASKMNESEVVLINVDPSYGQEVVTAGFNWDKIFFWRKSEENGDSKKNKQNDIASMYEMK